MSTKDSLPADSEERDTSLSNVQAISPARLRRQAETVLKQQSSGKANADLPPEPEAMQAALYELQVHQIELEIQNEELRQAKEQLDNSHQRYIDLYDQAPACYCRLTEQGLILQANQTMATLLGVSKHSLVGLKLTDFIAPDGQDSYYLANRQLRKSGLPQSCELRILIDEGPAVWFFLTNKFIYDENARTSIAVVLIGIDERKLAQLAKERSEQKFRHLAEDMPFFVASFTPDGSLTFINALLANLWNRTPKELLGKNFHALQSLPECERDSIVSRLVNLTPDKPMETHEQPYLTSAGETLFHQWTQHAFFNTNGQITHFQAIGEDITLRKQAEDDLRVSAAAFDCQNAMIITNAEGTILRVNSAFSRITGFTSQEAIGQLPGVLLQSGRHDSSFYQSMWDSIKQHGSWQGEIWNKNKNGLIYAEMLSITAVSSPNRGTTHYVGSFTDITKDKEAEAIIHRLAYYDPLTNLPNRRLLQDRLGQAITATERSGQYGAIFFIDLDNFKALNDTRGHDAGDLLLTEIALRLKKFVRKSDTVARMGGDEFVVLLENLGKSVNKAVNLSGQLSEKLRSAMDKPFYLRDHEYHCAISIGIGLFDQQQTIENLFKHADLALYQAKNSGRNAIRFFDPAMQATLDARNTLEMELRLALNLNQLVLHYQPQVNASGHLIGCEALLRWHHPRLGLVLPDEFITLAEGSGQIIPIGLWVLESACKQLRIWENTTETSKLQLSVNVSARQFRQPDFVAQVTKILLKSGVAPARLTIELTESVLLEDIEAVIEKMHTIKGLNIKFALDDFGTGFSSLSYLAVLPFDQLKIDKSFISNIPFNSSDATIARTIITMGQELSMNVVAEGVETVEQQAFLSKHECNAYQGYLFSHPLTEDDLARFIEQTSLS